MFEMILRIIVSLRFFWRCMPMNSVEVKGVNETLKAMEKRLGDKKVRSIARKAINTGAEKVEKRLQSDMLVFKDQGYTIDEVVRKNATYKNYNTEAEIGWNGPHQRYRLIHLNEWGYTRNGRQIKPRGFGVITKSLKNSEPFYLSTVEMEVKKSL
nr:MAG TPA: tail component [Caudoviricetes sp.]